MKNFLSKCWLCAVVALAFLSFGLRVLFIEKQSLRGDEALSVIYAQKSLSEIIEITRFTSGHPPMFYVLLHFWEGAVGTTEFATRFFAVWWGVLIVPLVFVLGRSLFGTEAAIWAALLVAINPFHIMHAQDIRSYTMLAVGSALSCLMFWRALHRSHWKDWALYIASSVFVVYGHYFGAFLILTHAVFFAYYWLLQRRLFWQGVVSFGTIGAFLLPWLWLARTVVTGGHGPGGRTLSLWGMMQQCMVTFGVGYWRESWGEGLLVVGLALLLGLGVWKAFHQAPGGTFLLGLAILIPLLCLFVLSRSRPIFRERYLVISAPVYSLLWGAGLAFVRFPQMSRVWLQRLVSGVSTLLLVGFNMFALTRYYFSPAYAKSPEWREAVLFLQERLEPGDAVVLNHQDQAFLYYYAGSDLFVLPSPGEQNLQSVRESMQDLIARYNRIWLLPDTAQLWDKEGFVRWWLDQSCEMVTERSWRGVLLLVYHTPRQLVEEMVSVDASLEGGIRLLGYVVRDEHGNAVDRIGVRPGQSVRLTLYWQAASGIDEDYVVFAHLLDGTGWLRGQQDGQPRWGTFPTKAWTPGEWVVDPYQIPLAADAPPGEYTIEVGMYRPDDGTRLSIAGADADVEQRRVLLRDRVYVR